MLATINHQAFVAELSEDKIFCIRYKANTVSTVQDLKAGYEAYLMLCQGKPLPVLIEIGEGTYFDMEANECIKEGKILPKAEAIVTDSLAIRLMVDYYLYSRKNKHNVRLFKTKENALNWLNSEFKN